MAFIGTQDRRADAQTDRQSCLEKSWEFVYIWQPPPPTKADQWLCNLIFMYSFHDIVKFRGPPMLPNGSILFALINHTTIYVTIQFSCGIRTVEWLMFSGRISSHLFSQLHNAEGNDMVAVNTFQGRDTMAAISQTTHSSVFYWMKILEFGLKFHWSLFPKAGLMIFQHWFRPGVKPLSEPMMVRLPTHICVTRTQSVNRNTLWLISRCSVWLRVYVILLISIMLCAVSLFRWLSVK